MWTTNHFRIHVNAVIEVKPSLWNIFVGSQRSTNNKNMQNIRRIHLNGVGPKPETIWKKEFGAGHWWSKPLDPWAQDSKPSHARKILDHHKFPSFHVFPPHRHPAVWANRPPHPLKPQWQLLPRQYLHVLVTKRKEKKTTLNSQRSQEVDLFYDRLQGYRSVTVPATSETSKREVASCVWNLGIWLYLSHQEARIHPGPSLFQQPKTIMVLATQAAAAAIVLRLTVFN